MGSESGLDTAADVAQAAAAAAPTPTGRYLVHLMVRGLAQRAAEDPPAGASWEAVHRLAAFHSVEGLTWFAVRDRNDLDPELKQAWQLEAERTLWTRIQFDVERERVLAALDEAGFSYLPLKGAVLAPCYPDPSMRSMCDNDILYGYVEGALGGGYRVRGATKRERERTVEEATRDVTRVMEGLGYHPKHLGAGNADAFIMAPCFNFELHRMLAEEALPFAWYFENPWERAVADGSESGRAFHFSPEDDYIYRTTHTYKHYRSGGCGIRHLADTQVFLATHAGSLDWDYVEGELERLEMLGFERALRGLTEELFGGAGETPGCDGLSQEGAQMLGYLLSSGIYGTEEHHVANDVARGGGSGARYALARFVPAPQELKANYPVLRRWPILYPFVVVWRWLKALAHLGSTLREARLAFRAGREGEGSARG